MAYLNKTTATEVYMAQQRVYHFAKKLAHMTYRQANDIPLEDGRPLAYYEGMLDATYTMLECLLSAHHCYNGYTVKEMVSTDGHRCRYRDYSLNKAIRHDQYEMLEAA